MSAAEDALPIELPPLIPFAKRHTHRVAHGEVVLRYLGTGADEEGQMRRLARAVHAEFGDDALTTTIDGEVIAP